jgi:hypothetical protein
LLRWSSRVVAVVSWFFIPVLVGHSTVVLGLIGPLGVQILCSHTAALAMTDRTAAASYEAATAALAELGRRREALAAVERGWPRPWPWWRRPTQSRGWLLAVEAVVLVAASLPGLIMAGGSSRFLWGALIILGLSLLIVLSQHTAIPGLGLKQTSRARDRAVTVGGFVFAVPFAVLAAELANQAADAGPDVALSAWSGLPLLIAFGGLLWIMGQTPGHDYFAAARGAAMDRQLERLERAQRQAKELMEAHQG